jgi:hypothetical protein
VEIKRAEIHRRKGGKVRIQRVRGNKQGRREYREKVGINGDAGKTQRR